MSESSIMIVLLSIISCCVVVLTVVACRTAQELRNTLKRVNRAVPHWDQAIQEARGAMKQTHELLARTKAAAQHVETMLAAVAQLITETIGPILLLNTNLKSVLGKHIVGDGAKGNGHRAKSGSRRHSRRRHL